jgi:hypothetical protein
MRRPRSPKRQFSTWCLSHGARSAGCRISIVGQRSSATSSNPVVHCTSPRHTRLQWCSMMRLGCLTGGRVSSHPISRARWKKTHDYIDETMTVVNATTYTWVHPLGDIISGLLRAGMLDWLHEHDGVTWHMFDVLVRSADGLWRWPDKPWLPLAFSLRATRRR